MKMERTWVGAIGGRSVWVRLDNEGQEILLENAGAVGLLGLLLAPAGARRIEQGEDGCEYVVVPHSEQVDRLLVELIDLLIHVRVMHPTMVQLELELSKEQGEDLGLLLEGLS